MRFNLPDVILPSGEINPKWSEAYQEQSGCSYLESHTQRQAAIFAMKEPSLVTEKGKLNKVWLTWFKVNRKVSNNIALATGKRKLKTMLENSNKAL